MALRLNSASAGLARTIGIIAASSNYTSMCWHRSTIVPSAGNYLSIFQNFNSPTSTEWAGVFSDIDSINVELSLPDGALSGPVTQNLNKWNHIAYTRTGTTHRWYVNGSLVSPNIVKNISAYAFTKLVLGFDGSSNDSGSEYAYFREWNAALSQTEIKTEAINTAAVRTSGLNADTPLVSDLLDDSGNGNDWTAVGSTSFVSDPSFPSNLTSATATVIVAPTLVITQDAKGADTDYIFVLWFKYVALTGDDELGIFPSGNHSTYRPSNFIFSPDAVTSYVDGNADARNLPVQIPTIPGNTYWIRIDPGLGTPTNGDLTLTLTPHTRETVPLGSIAINDDTDLLPLTLVSALDGDDNHVLSYLGPVASSDGGDILEDGKVLLSTNASGDTNLYIYDSAADYALLTTVPYGAIAFTRVRTCLGTQRWWVGRINASTLKARFVNPDGTLGTEHVCTGIANSQRLAAANDESILYSGRNDLVTQPIKRWDLIGDTLLSDLTAGPTNYRCTDILVCHDDNILVGWYNITTHDFQVIRYDPAGTVLNTYSFGTNEHVFGTLNAYPRLAYALDDPISFWVMRHLLTPFGVTRFVNTRISDGVALATIDYMSFANGVYADDTTPPPAPPIAYLGISNSCPFWVGNQGIVPPPEEKARLTVGKVTDPFDGTQEFDFTAGGGLSPADFTLLSDEEQVYEDLDPGEYSIVETEIEGWKATYLVSNDPDNDNLHIVLEAGDDVTVMVVNQLRRGNDGLYIYPPNPTDPPPLGPPPKKHDTTINNQGEEEDSPIPLPFVVTGFIRDN